MKYLAALLMLVATQGFAQSAVSQCVQMPGGYWYLPGANHTTNSKDLCELEAFAESHQGIVDDTGAQIYNGGTVQLVTDSGPDEYPASGAVSCESGYRMQRYSQALEMRDTTGQDEMYSGWRNVDAGPHDGDYRCVKNEKPVLLHRGDAVGFIGSTDGAVAIPTPYTSTDDVFRTDPSLYSTSFIAQTYTFPAGTKCGPEGDAVVCHMPENK